MLRAMASFTLFISLMFFYHSTPLGSWSTFRRQASSPVRILQSCLLPPLLPRTMVSLNQSFSCFLDWMTPLWWVLMPYGVALCFFSLLSATSAIFRYLGRQTTALNYRLPMLLVLLRRLASEAEWVPCHQKISWFRVWIPKGSCTNDLVSTWWLPYWIPSRLPWIWCHLQA